MELNQVLSSEAEVETKHLEQIQDSEEVDNLRQVEDSLETNHKQINWHLDKLHHKDLAVSHLEQEEELLLVQD